MNAQFQQVRLSAPGIALAIILSLTCNLAFANTRVGTAVFYSDKMDGHPVSLKGEKYDKNALTAATHKGFPLGSRVKVTNLANHKSVIVRVNDRMNPKSHAVIDLSRKAAEELDMIDRGHRKVRIESIDANSK